MGSSKILSNHYKKLELLLPFFRCDMKFEVSYKKYEFNI